jgi:hypothetical protein
MIEDVCVFRVKGREVQSYARGSQKEAEDFIRNPKWPAQPGDNFIAVDDWGHGKITAASRGYENWVGKEVYQFRREVHSA